MRCTVEREVPFTFYGKMNGISAGEKPRRLGIDQIALYPSRLPGPAPQPKAWSPSEKASSPDQGGSHL